MLWYATREEVKAAMDYKETARNDLLVDRAIESGSRTIEGMTHRKFYPWTGTRYFPWPADRYTRPYRLYLDEDELISLITLTSGGTVIPPADYFLEPVNLGPPYTHVEVNLGSSSAFSAGSTHQRSIAMAGLWGGCPADTDPAGALSAASTLTTATTCTVTNSAAIGVGQIIQVDDERMIVTAKTMLDTGQNLGTALAASTAATTVVVTTGSAYVIGEVLLLDSERMLIVDIAGNNLTVKRAWDGSVLATHTSSDIYAPRTLVVERGALGTTAATHLNSAPITKHRVPGLVNQLCIAEAAVGLQQQSAGYARVVGSGDNQREAAGKGLADLRQQVYTTYGRKARMRSV